MMLPRKMIVSYFKSSNTVLHWWSVNYQPSLSDHSIVFTRWCQHRHKNGQPLCWDISSSV